MKVYKANGGWVKQFDDGTVAGPFTSRAQANAAIDKAVFPKAELKIRENERVERIIEEKPKEVKKGKW